MADTTAPAVDPVAALEAREAAVCFFYSLQIDVGIDITQVLAREQAVEKKEKELAAREEALAAKENPPPAEPEAAKQEPAVETEKAVEPEAVVSFPTSSHHQENQKIKPN
jgi:predicted transcriptional regulator